MELTQLNALELKKTNGGGWAAVATIYAAILAGAYYVGYSDGKDPCPPPPCT